MSPLQQATDALKQALDKLDRADAAADLERAQAVARRVEDALPRLDQLFRAAQQAGQIEIADQVLSIKSCLMGLES